MKAFKLTPYVSVFPPTEPGVEDTLFKFVTDNWEALESGNITFDIGPWGNNDDPDHDPMDD